MAKKPLYQSAPATEDQPSGPSAKIAHPLPGFAPEDDVAPDEFEWQSAPVVFDDTHSVFNRFNRVGRSFVTKAFGAPVDLANEYLRLVAPPLASEEPLGGSESFNRLFSLFNFSGETGPATQEDVETIEGRVSQFLGIGASMLLPLGGAAKPVVQGLRGLRPKPTSITGRIVHDMAEQAFIRKGARAPFTRTLLREGAAATLAGVGGQLVFQQFPDSQAAIILGEIIGGMTPAGMVAATKLTLTAAGGRIAKRAILKTFTQEGGRQRAEKRVGAVVRDKDKALEGLKQEGAVLAKAELTPAQQAGDVGLLSLEKSVINSSEKLKATADEQITRAVEVIQKTVLEAGKGVPTSATVQVLERARSHLVDLMNVRMQIAARVAEEQIAAIGSGVTRNEANMIVKKVVDDVLDDANEQIGQLFDAVPLEVVVPVTGSREFLTALVKKTPLAQREDIPTVALRLLKAKSKEAQEMDALFAEAEAAFGVGEKEVIAPFGSAVAVKELQGLRSKLLEEARTARAAGQFNKARLADDIAEAVLDDMGAAREAVTGEAGAKLRLALDFTADVKDRFNKGTIRKLLKPDRQGGDTIPAPLTLEATIARGGPKAKVELDALTKAMRVKNPRTGKVMGDEPKMRQAVEDFLLDEFQREVLPQGVIKRTAADTYLGRFQDILDDFPGLRARLRKAIETNDFSVALRKEGQGLPRRLNDPKVTRTAVFLKEPVDDAMKRISKSSEPVEVMKDVIKEAKLDPTGDALLGLKTGYGDFLLSQSRKIAADTLEYNSGRTLKQLLNSGSSSKMAKTLFSKEELKRLDQAAETAVKIEKAIRAKPREGGVLSDAPNMLFLLMARVGGVMAGSRLGQILGRATIQLPAMGSELAKGAVVTRTRDPARRLLMDAVQDKDLFQALLDPIESGVISATTRRQLNLWVIGVARESLPELDEEDLALLEGAPTAQPLVPEEEEVEEETDGGTAQAKEGVDLTTLQPEAQSGLETALRSEEGEDLTVFLDTEKNPTVGVGHKVLSGDNLKVGDTITKEQSEELFRQDLEEARRGATDILKKLNEPLPEVEDIIVQMVFQMGKAGAKAFKKTLKFIKKKKYAKAADELLKSKFAKQTPERANRLAEQLRSLASDEAP